MTLEQRIEILEKLNKQNLLIQESIHEWMVASMSLMKELREEINFIKQKEEWR